MKFTICIILYLCLTARLAEARFLTGTTPPPVTTPPPTTCPPSTTPCPWVPIPPSNPPAACSNLLLWLQANLNLQLLFGLPAGTAITVQAILAQDVLNVLGVVVLQNYQIVYAAVGVAGGTITVQASVNISGLISGLICGLLGCPYTITSVSCP